MTLEKLKPGLFYSNGAYGRTWVVRQLASSRVDEGSGETFYEFKDAAGICRRKKGHCSSAEFARWAKYQVVLLENDWKRVVDPDDAA